MQDHLFEYAVIRLVPKVEREEFLNAGVILFCRDLQFLGSRINFDEQKIMLFCPDCDIRQLQENLSSFDIICAGDPAGGIISALSMAERFRWLTATRSTAVQTSFTHPGFCTDASETLEKLFRELVL